MSRKTILTFFIIHLIIITGAATINSASNYAEYFNNESTLLKYSLEMLHNNRVDAYLQLTGLETGYGFFGYNVRSNGCLYFKTVKSEIVPFFNDYESRNRFGTMTSVITDPYLKDTSNIQAQEHMNSEIMLRNMALKMLSAKKMNQFNSIKVIYRILEFPTLKKYRLFKGEFHETDLFEINYLKETNVH